MKRVKFILPKLEIVKLSCLYYFCFNLFCGLYLFVNVISTWTNFTIYRQKARDYKDYVKISRNKQCKCRVAEFVYFIAVV